MSKYFNCVQFIYLLCCDQPIIVPATANPNHIVTGLTPGTEYSIDVSGVANGDATILVSARESTGQWNFCINSYCYGSFVIFCLFYD